MSELPEGWVETEIENIYEVARGGSPRPIKSYLTADDDGLNWIKISDATSGGYRIESTEQKITSEGLHKTRLIYPGDLLLSNSMSFGKPYISAIEGCIHDGWLVLGGFGKKCVDTRYMHLALSSEGVQKQFDEKASGSTVRNLNTGIVNSVRVPLAPLAEQKRIVAKIESLTAKSRIARENLARIDTLTKRYKQAILKKAFSGELTADWREKSSKDCLIDLNDVLKEHEVIWQNNIAKKGKYARPNVKPADDLRSWHELSLEGLAYVVDPHPSHRTPPKEIGGIPYVGVGDVKLDGKLDFAGARKVSPKVLKDHLKRYSLKRGDFAYGKIGTIGQPFLLPEAQEYALSANVILIQPRSKFATAEFLYYFFLSPVVTQKILGASVATSQAAFGIKKMREVLTPLPSLSEQNEIVTRIEKAFAKIDKLAEEAKRALHSVDRLDEKILAKAFRGELVPQDPDDEPASVLLERIKAERAAQPKVKRARKPRKAKEVA